MKNENIENAGRAGEDREEIVHLILVCLRRGQGILRASTSPIHIFTIFIFYILS